ncbi:class I SAM-dependent methyltransferase [Lysobacter soyae]|uniref:Methyltransferase domain-containing protein n=1 Tax=Lysobacter soyae TaxID=2764185 RepID=A0ABX8WM71_9GAMM|nr:class I SAM-dependent methyltransferase [Lysobacter sp. CJ11]QYR52737.1 methyltransferase domain-containing protein [Lysobacter sp. CJ11]
MHTDTGFVNVERVIRQVSRRVALDSQSVHQGAEVVWKPTILSRQNEYALSDLMAFHGPAFVRNAYVAILRRLPDPGGFAMNCEALERGARSRIEILAELRWSPEGEAHRVHIDGLLGPTLVERWKRKRWIGRYIRLADRFVGYTEPNVHITHALNRIAIEQEAQSLKLFNIADAVLDLKDNMSDLVSELATYQNGHANLVREINEIGRFVEHELKSALTVAKSEISDIHTQLSAHGYWIAKEDDARRTAKEKDQSQDAIYVDFEKAFRGSSALIRQRLQPYVDLLKRQGVGAGDLLLDVGCGNGEMLEVLGDAGFEAVGVDTNTAFIDGCKARNLSVVLQDGIEYLEEQEAASVAAISAIHLAEHLDFSKLIELVDESLRVLRPGGVLILETPNPENLLVSSRYFYLDPTHRNPIPPETLQWLLKTRGFGQVETLRLREARGEMPVAHVSPDQPGADPINKFVELLTAAPDYAVIGIKE